MNPSDTMHPPEDSWVTAIHESQDDFTPLGAGVVIDDHRVLTCAHVVQSEGRTRDPIWVAFPKADEASSRRKVASVIVPNAVSVYDLAVLVLADAVPTGVTAAPLRCPKPSDLAGRPWWAFGFANADPLGNSASGIVGAPLAYGWVRVDAESRYHVAPGFSGSGLWSPDYRAVVAVVGAANDRGDGKAITLHQADACLPELKIRLLAGWTVDETSEQALAAWGWTLERDPEGGRHWRPRARGVTVDSERGYRFRGRTAALRTIAGWLDRELPDRRALVVTGSPGVGKSAVLGRIVTTADRSAAAALPISDQAVRAALGSVACAVHAKGKTALEVALEIARAASAALPDTLEDAGPALRTALAERGRQRFNVIIDALDEASSPAEARAIVTGIVLPLVETCADVGAQVVVGTRHRDEDGDLLAAFGESMALIDLDDARFFSVDDLAAYALATLQLAGDERQGNPYADITVATAVARRIAALSGQNFLVAGLTARAHGLHDERAADPSHLSFTPTVDSALRTYLRRISPVDNVSAEALLTALAFAEAPGIPVELWQTAVGALGAGDITTAQLSRFARSSAANFLVESGGNGVKKVFRLFHQALNDALLRARSEVQSARDDERALTQAFAAFGRQQQWQHAPGYLLRSLSAHAARAGLIDDLLTEDGYLLHADLRRLIPLADSATSATGVERARLMRLTPEAIVAGPLERIALFSVTESMEGLGASFTAMSSPAPYRAQWAQVNPRVEIAVMHGHSLTATGVCAFSEHGRTLLATAGIDRTVRIWDPATGTLQATMEGHASHVYSICTFTHDGRTLLATGGLDRIVRIWDPATGVQRASMGGARGWVNAVCAFTVDGRTLLASGDSGGMVLIWDPATGTQQATLEGHTDHVNAVCAFTHDSRTLLATGGNDNTVRIWDPATGTQQATLEGHSYSVEAICAFAQGDRTLLATGSVDSTVRIWDPAAGAQHHLPTDRPGWSFAVCAFAVDGQTLLAVGGRGPGVRIWDLATGTQRPIIADWTRWVSAICAFTVDDRVLLASSDLDRMVICDPTTGDQLTTLTGHPETTCAFIRDGRTVVASGGADSTVRIWDPATGALLIALEGHTGPVNALSAFDGDGRTLLASGSDDNTIRIWDPAAGTEQTILTGHTNRVRAVCAFTHGDRTLLASAGDDNTVRIWDPATTTQQALLEGHTDWVRAVNAFSHGGRTLLASGCDDSTVRIWDTATGAMLQLVPVHHQVQGLDYSSGLLAIALTAGVLVVELNAHLGPDAVIK